MDLLALQHHYQSCHTHTSSPACKPHPPFHSIIIPHPQVTTMATPHSQKLIVLITGANTGLGYETVKTLLSAPAPPPSAMKPGSLPITGYHILLGSRSVERGEAARARLTMEVPETVSTVEVVQIDVSSDESIAKAAKMVTDKFGRLDVLVNNAGHSLDFAAAAGKCTTRANFAQTYDVNVTGAHICTSAFLPLLLLSSSPFSLNTTTRRILFVTSGLSSFAVHAEKPIGGFLAIADADTTTGGAPEAYRASKFALNSVMLAWHWRLQEDAKKKSDGKGPEVKVFCVSPGFLATGLGFGDAERLKSVGGKDPGIGARLMREVVEGKHDDKAGKVVSPDGGVQPW